MDGDERVQPRPLPPADEHRLMVERLRVAVGVRRSRRGPRAHCEVDGVPAVPVPVDDPVLLEVVPCELSVDEPDEVDWVEVVEPDCVLDVEPLAVWPDCVESVPVDVTVPVLDVVVFVEPLVWLAVPSVGLLGVAPPGLTAVEVPPVGRSVTLTVTVVVVAGAVVVACEPGDEADVVTDPFGSVVPGDCEVELAGAAIAGARSLEAAVSSIGAYADSEAVTRRGGAAA